MFQRYRPLIIFLLSALSRLQIAYLLINVFSNCCFLRLFTEEEWNSDGKGRQSNDTGEFFFSLLWDFIRERAPQLSSPTLLSFTANASAVNLIYFEMNRVESFGT